MNTFWLKIAGVAVIALGALIALSIYWSGEGSSPRSNSDPDSGLTGKLMGENEAFSDVVREDSQRLRASPKQAEQPQSVEPEDGQESVASAEPEAEVAEIKFKPMTQEDEIEAERLLEFAIKHRSMSRVGTIGLKTTVDTCRQIIERWPGTEYEFKAKRVLSEIPERHRDTYNITPEEIDLGGLK